MESKLASGRMSRSLCINHCLVIHKSTLLVNGDDMPSPTSLPLYLDGSLSFVVLETIRKVKGRLGLSRRNTLPTSLLILLHMHISWSVRDGLWR